MSGLAWAVDATVDGRDLTAGAVVWVGVALWCLWANRPRPDEYPTSDERWPS